jgi:hypothetical protein
MRWCGTRKPKPPPKGEETEELREVCSAVLAVYLCAEMAKDQAVLADPLQDAIDRALIAASNADKKHNFGLF